MRNQTHNHQLVKIILRNPKFLQHIIPPLCYLSEEEQIIREFKREWCVYLFSSRERELRVSQDGISQLAKI